MKRNIIIPVRPSDAWVSFSVKDCCKTVPVNPPILSLWRPACVKDTRVCAGVDACGAKIWRVIPAVIPRVTLIGDLTPDNCGRIRFQLTEAFKAMGSGRLDGTLTGNGFTLNVQFQVFADSSRVTDYAGGCSVAEQVAQSD